MSRAHTRADEQADTMTVRERFVMAALQGLLANPANTDFAHLPDLAVVYADATLEAMEGDK